MKKYILIPILLALFAACNTAPQNDKVPDDTAVLSDSAAGHDPLGPIWKYEFNPDTEEFDIIQLRPVDKDTLTGEAVEKIINNTWPRVQIRFSGTSNDTAFVSIPDSEALTQQMGSAGAESFMITATFSFTCMQGINHVRFDFAEGDHGVPGVYNRNSWKVNVRLPD